MIHYKINRIHTILLITILITWFIIFILTVLMIFQERTGNLPYLLGIIGIVEFALLFLTGISGMLIKKKAANETDDDYDDAFVKLTKKAASYPENINKRMAMLYYYGNLYIIVLIVTILEPNHACCVIALLSFCCAILLWRSFSFTINSS